MTIYPRTMLATAYAAALFVATLQIVVAAYGVWFKGRSDGKVVKKCVYSVLGISVEGKKDILGIWVTESESASFWVSVEYVGGVRHPEAELLDTCGGEIRHLRRQDWTLIA